jgi:hypothetical protein
MPISVLGYFGSADQIAFRRFYPILRFGIPVADSNSILPGPQETETEYPWSERINA